MKRRQFVVSTAAAAAAMAAGPVGAVDAGTPVGDDARTALDADRFHAARRYASTRFGQIAWVERGAGPAALFLHGFPLNGFQWRGALERLAGHRRCIAPDFLGLGFTQVAGGQGVAPEDQVDMLLALLDRLGVDAADVVANDSGGAVAQLLAVRAPRRVRSLLLTNCDSEPDCPPAVLQPVFELAREGRFVSEWLAPWLADGELARSPEGLGGLTYTRPDELKDATLRMYLAPLVHAADRTHDYALALNRNVLAGIAPALGRCAVPVRIVWGTGDKTFAADGPDYLDRVFGNSQGVRRVEGANLFFPEEYPDLIAEEARRLWGVV